MNHSNFVRKSGVAVFFHQWNKWKIMQINFSSTFLQIFVSQKFWYHYKNHLFICKSTQIKSNVITICEALWSNMNNELMVRYAIRCIFELEIIILRIDACDVGNKICTDFMISRYIRFIFPRNDAYTFGQICGFPRKSNDL